MKRHHLYSALVCVPLAFSACSKEQDTSDNVITEAPADEYPLTTCVVSGEPLGSMGEPIIYDHNGTTVKLCCKNCIPAFEKDPESYIAKIK